MRIALLALLLSLAPIRPALAQDAAEDPALTEAMARFEGATALFDRGDHRGALAEFERIYALLEGHPHRYFVLYNIGQCEEQLFRYDLALDAYRRYLAEGGQADPEHATVEATLRTLEGLLGTVEVVLTDAPSDLVVEVWAADRQVGVAPGEIRLPGGQHALEFRAAGYETVRQTATVTARARASMTVTLPRLSDFHGLSPAFFAVGLGAAVASALVGAVLGGLALGARGDADRCLADTSCAFALDLEGQERTIRDLALGADVSFGIAGALGVTSLILALFTDFDAHADAVALDVGPGGATLRGTF